MGTRGLIVYKWKGLYYVTYNHRDSYPEALGAGVASRVPSDPDAFEAWKSNLISKFEKIAAECLADNFAHNKHGYESSPTGTPAYNDLFIEWVYTHDLDRDVFIVSSANDDNHRLYFNIRNIPVHLFHELDIEIVNLERPGYTPAPGEEVYQRLEGDEVYLASWLFEEPNVDEKYVAALDKLEKSVVSDVHEMFPAKGNVSANKMNIGLWILQCFYRQYYDPVRYQRTRYSATPYVARQLTRIILGLLSCAAGVGKLYNRVIENDPMAHVKKFRELHSRCDALDEMFWLTDKVLVTMVQDLKDDEVTVVNALGQAALAVNNGSIPSAPAKLNSEAGKSGKFNIVVLSNALDYIMFVNIDTTPNNGSEPAVKYTKPLSMLSTVSDCIDENTQELSTGITACISFLSHVHSQHPPQEPEELIISNSQSGSRFLRLPAEVTQNILRYMDYKTYRSLSQTCALARAVCDSSSNIRLGDVTVFSTQLDVINSTTTEVGGRAIECDPDLDLTATVQHPSRLHQDQDVVFDIAYPYEGEKNGDDDGFRVGARPVREQRVKYVDGRKKEYFDGVIEVGVAGMEGVRPIWVTGLEFKAGVVCER